MSKIIKVINGCFDKSAACGLAMAAFATTASSEVLFEHLGPTDPIIEGWMGQSAGQGVTFGPQFDGSPRPGAWFVNDQSTASAGGYSRELTLCQESLIDTLGWTLRGCLLVDDVLAEPSIWMGYNTGSRRYDMWFTSQASGQVTVQIMTGDDASCGLLGPSFTTEQASPECGAPGYHVFELVFDPDAETADLFIDGIMRLENYGGHTIGLRQIPGVGWGAGSSCADGYAEFHLIQFEVNGPAPSVADLNCDGDVNGADLGILLLAWGKCLEQPGCLADLDGDGMIDGADLGTLLLNWTP